MSETAQAPRRRRTPAAKKEGSETKQTSTIFIPDKVVLLPISPNTFRLGLESTKEQFMRVPGTKYTWEPSKRGKAYLTGLQYISKAEKARLESAIGHTLNDDFYADLSYRMDGSNPFGHHMDLTVPLNKVIFLAMMDSHLIASSSIEYKKGRKPEAEWVIENQEAEAEENALDRDKMVKAVTAYGELSQHKRKAFCKIFGIKVQGLSPKVADNLLWLKIIQPPKNPGENVAGKKPIDRFLDMITWSEEKVNVHEEVEDAIASNVLRMNGAKDWTYADEILGSNKEQVINKLLMGENQHLRAAIKGKLSLTNR